MKPCVFERIAYDVGHTNDLPISIHFAQRQSSSVDDIEGSVGDGALPYFIDIYGRDDINTCPNGIKTLHNLFKDYKRPGITKKYLNELFYVFKLKKDYGSQALSPQYIDFTIACYGDKGHKINHCYTALLRELNSKDAYVLIDRQIDKYEKEDIVKNITVRISFKINNSNKKAIQLTKHDNKYNCYYYDPSESDALHELSILANASSYCLYKGNTALMNSFTFSIVKVENKSSVLTSPQTGSMLGETLDDFSKGTGGVQILKSYDNNCAKIYTSESGSKILDILYDNVAVNDFEDGPTDNSISIDASLSKMILEPESIQDYFRQVYNARRNDRPTDVASTPTMEDKYIIEFYPGVDIGSDDVLYLGTRLLEDDVFFYSDDKINGKIASFTCKTDDKAHSDTSEDSGERYRFNSMDQFEVYSFSNKSAPFGEKIAVEANELYDIDSKKSLLFNNTVGLDKTYEIVPRFDNMMFASISFKGADFTEITGYDILDYVGIYNNRSISELGAAYVFYKNLLYRRDVSLKKRFANKSNEFSPEGNIELCVHVPYDISNENDKYTHLDKEITLPDFDNYCNKNIFRDGVEVNIHDLGLNISADITSTDSNVYIYSSDEKVLYSEDIVFSEDDDGLRIHKYGNICNNDVGFNGLYNNIKKTRDDIKNSILYNTENAVYMFEEKYLSSFKESINLLTYETYGSHDMPLSNVASIKINVNNLPLYVYSGVYSGDNKLVDVLMNEESMCGKLIIPDTAEGEDEYAYYIPFYYKTDTEGGEGDIDTVCFLDKDGTNVTSGLEYNKYDSEEKSEFWTKIGVDGV